MSEILHGACAERSQSIQNDMPIEFFSTLLAVASVTLDPVGIAL